MRGFPITTAVIGALVLVRLSAAHAQECCTHRVVTVEVHDPEPVPEPYDGDPKPKPTPAPKEEPRLRVRGMLGAVAVASTDTEVSVEPFAGLAVAADLTEWASCGPVLDLDLQLTGLPAETRNDFEEPQNFRALELHAGLCQRLPRPLMFSVCATFGASSRLSTKRDPITRLPLFWAGEVLFEDKSNAHRFTIGLGPDQRLSGGWSPVLTVRGRVKLLRIARKGYTDPGGLFLVASYIRSLDDGFAGVPFFDSPRDALRVGLAVGL